MRLHHIRKEVIRIGYMNGLQMWFIENLAHGIKLLMILKKAQ